MTSHHDPLVTKLLQQRVVRKCEAVLKILVHLSFVLSIQMHARTRMGKRALARKKKEAISQHVMLCVRLSPVTRARLLASHVANYLVVTL